MRSMKDRMDDKKRAAITCPHCGVAGKVRGTQVKVKRGVSGGKATGALLTGGLSLVATGLSRKVEVTRLTCGNCRVSWTVE
jgi:transcription elongation factor Elf1